MLRNSSVDAVSCRLICSCVSRNVRYDSFHVGFMLTWVSCPSIHSQPSRSIHCLTVWLTFDTDHGVSGVLFGGPPACCPVIS